MNEIFLVSIKLIKTNTYVNNVDPDETAHNEPSHLDLHCLLFSFRFITDISICNDNLSKLEDRRVHCRNSGMKGLTSQPKIGVISTIKMLNYNTPPLSCRGQITLSNTDKVCPLAIPNQILLALSTLGKILSRRHFEIFFLFFPENRI